EAAQPRSRRGPRPAAAHAARCRRVAAGALPAAAGRRLRPRRQVHVPRHPRRPLRTRGRALGGRRARRALVRPRLGPGSRRAPGVPASRIESFPVMAGAADQPRPASIDLSAELERMLDSDDRDAALRRAAPDKALALRDRAGAALEEETFRLPNLPRPAARRLLLSDIRWVELLEPALWRDELAEVLAAIAAAHEGEADLSVLDRAAVRP